MANIMKGVLISPEKEEVWRAAVVKSNRNFGKIVVALVEGWLDGKIQVDLKED